MKNATGISRWTSAGRNHAVHILNDDGSLVLCKKHFFSHNTESFDFEVNTTAFASIGFNSPANVAANNTFMGFNNLTI